MICDGKARE